MRNSCFDRNTEEILCKAGFFARELGHSFVGSEHILLSLSAAAGSPAARILGRSRAGFPELYELAVRIRGRGVCRRLPQGLSSGARSIICRAVERTGPHAQVCPEQLLWAIGAENATTAALMLVSCGVCPEQLCTLVRQEQTTEKGGVSMRLLEQFGVNMVEKAANGEPVIGRGEQIDTLIEVLCRKHKNNPALVGDPGVGKTAIVEGLARRMAAGQVPPQLRERRLYALDMAAMVAGTKYRGEFEERMRDVLAEIQRAGNIIVFVDEMHMLVGAGAAEGAIDAANILKPALSRGQLQLIGATTAEEYRKFIEKDAALERRFRRIPVKEPTAEESVEILRGLRPGLERHHGLRIGDDAIEAAVRLSRRYLCGYYLPDKAIDLLDEGAAHAVLKMRQAQMGEGEGRRALDEELRCAIAQEDFAQALAVQSRIRALRADERENGTVLRPEDICHALFSRTGIPVCQLDTRQRDRLRNLEAELSRRVVGQPQAVAAAADAVRRGRTGISGSGRPVAAILLTGPTGTGKTELCRALAECVYGSTDDMIRLDMSEYMEKHSVSRLLGAPPGYVGYEQGGELTEKVRRRPYALVLFDEMDKAHPDVAGILLQIMEDGRLTDSTGRCVDFTNTLLLMTANIGAAPGSRGSVGFVPDTRRAQTMEALRAHFPAEFLGRLDAVAVFSPLGRESLLQIAEMQLAQLQTRLDAQDLRLIYTPAAAEYLAGQCAGKGGAREVRRLVQQQVEAPLARLLLDGRDGSFCLSVGPKGLCVTPER